MTRKGAGGEQSKAENLTGFVLSISARPVLVFRASSQEEAHRLCQTSWFNEKLARYKSNGSPIWAGRESRSIFPVNGHENARLARDYAEEMARGGDVSFVFGFLVPIDPESS